MLRRKLLWAAIAVAAVLALLTGSARYLAGRFKPFLRDQTVNYLENRFDGDVELASFDVSMPIRDPFGCCLKKGRGPAPGSGSTASASATGFPFMPLFASRTIWRSPRFEATPDLPL